MHPLITAYLSLMEEGPVFRVWRSHRETEPMYYGGNWKERVEWYYELVASEKVPNLSLGFYNSSNPCAEGFFVWLFNGVFQAEVFYPLTKS